MSINNKIKNNCTLILSKTTFDQIKDEITRSFWLMPLSTRLFLFANTLKFKMLDAAVYIRVLLRGKERTWTTHMQAVIHEKVKRF